MVPRIIFTDRELHVELAFRVVGEYRPKNRVTKLPMLRQKCVGTIAGAALNGHYYFVHCPHGKTAGPYHSTVYADRMVSAPWLFCDECKKLLGA